MRSDFARALRLIGEGSAVLTADGGLALCSPGTADPLTLDAASVIAMVSDGLLVRLGDKSGDRVARTAEGRAYLRRSLCTVADDAFAAQHQLPVARVVGGVTVTANAAESPLAWLATRRDRDGNPMLSREEYEAGCRLSADHERGHQRTRVTQSWDRSGVRGGAAKDRMSVTEAAADARRRVDAALAAVGPGLAEILVAVCCDEVGLETVEKRSRWPARSGKVVLRLALERLAAHYGLASAAVGGRPQGLVRWNRADYRPSAQAV